MRAVILAAGRGTRLGGMTMDLPKGLLPVGGRALILHSLDRLSEAGIEETMIVTGHGAEALRRRLGDAHGSMRLTYRHNDDFDRGGSMMSLLAADPAPSREIFLVLESDILYHGGFIAAALVAPEENVLLAADPTGSGDEVFLCATEHGRLSFLGKDARREHRLAAVGEFAGISRISGRFFELFVRRVEMMMAAGDAEEHHYEEIFFDLAQQGAPVHVLACPRLPWTEVDNVADLARAKDKVWPALNRAPRPRRS